MNATIPSSPRFFSVLILLASLFAMGVREQPAHAQFRVCNHHDYQVRLAIAFPGGDEWVTRGWYAIDAGSCSNVLRSISNRYYYVTYDVEGTTDSPLTEGEHLLCVETNDFTIYGTKNCTQRGYKTRLFSQIDVGRRKIAWYQLDLTSVRSTREAIKSVRVRMRHSFLDRSTQVVMLQNISPHYIEFDLRCYKRSGQSKLLPIVIEGGKTAEVGFVQGWSGNFVSGERCEAYFDGEKLWSYSVR